MIEIQNLTKIYRTSSHEFYALNDINLSVEDKDIFGIIGMSGAGKSTLVRCINRLEKPTDGHIIIDGVDLANLSENELRKMRRKIAMVFQGFNLLMQKNCLDNVCFPMILEGINKNKAKEKALELLATVGLKDKYKSYPSELSGGQQQRVAIARALASNPKVLLCDEATSALDPNTTQSILKLLKEINEHLGITIIMITHQMSVVESICKHVAILDNGQVVETGEVADVFSHPKTLATKKLVFPEGSDEAVIVGEKDEHFIRLVYSGSDVTRMPLIARLAVTEHIEANIASASTRNIEGKTYGTILLGIKGSDEDVLRAKNFLQKHSGVIVEEVKVNVV